MLQWLLQDGQHSGQLWMPSEIEEEPKTVPHIINLFFSAFFQLFSIVYKCSKILKMFTMFLTFLTFFLNILYVSPLNRCLVSDVVTRIVKFVEKIWKNMICVISHLICLEPETLMAFLH